MILVSALVRLGLTKNFFGKQVKGTHGSAAVSSRLTELCEEIMTTADLSSECNTVSYCLRI